MTVSTTSSRTLTNGNGTTTAFPTGFEFNAGTSLVVTLITIATGVETPKVITTDYTVAGGLGNEGTVNMLVAPTTLELLVVERAEDQDQQTDYTRNDPFPAEVNEAALDKLTFLIQDILDKVNRSLLLTRASTLSGISIPDPQDGYILIGTADGGFENVHISDLPGIGAGGDGEVNPDLISQVEAEAGIAITERIFSALRVAQAIEAQAVTINDDIRTGALALVSTDDGFAPGPTLTLYRDSASPANADELGSVYWDGNNSDDELTAYARAIGVILDPTAGTEDGELQLQAINNGVFLGQLSLANGVRVGVPVGEYKGYGSLNAQSLYINGVAVGTGGEVNPDLISQAEAEAGVATTERIFSALRVKQAIAALEAGSFDPSSPTEIGDNTPSTGDFLALTATRGSGDYVFEAEATGAQDVTVVGKTTSGSSGVLPIFELRKEGEMSALRPGGALDFYLNVASKGIFRSSRIGVDLLNWSSGSETVAIYFETFAAGTLAKQMTVGEGVIIGAPTDLYKGVGTLNAVAVYDDGSGPLTHYVLEAKNTGKIDLEWWDATMPEGKLHEPARRFDLNNLVPKWYTTFWKKRGHLPALPSQEEWQANRPGTGDLVQRLIETVEVLAVHGAERDETIAGLERRIAALEARSV